MAPITWKGNEAQNRKYAEESSGGKFQSLGAQINLLGREDLRSSVGLGLERPKTSLGSWHPSDLVLNHSAHLLPL